MGPSSRPNGMGMSQGSPRPGGAPGGARPTSELLGSPGLFQTPECTCQPDLDVTFTLNVSAAEALDQWFENLQTYEVTLVQSFAIHSSPILTDRTGRNGCCLS